MSLYKPSSIDNKTLNFSQKVIHWYDRHGRKNLPWQPQTGQQANPYHVWLSEIMLQQTQVVKVIEYFDRFIKVLPTLNDLANTGQQQVLSLWSGLGYYNRAKNLHQTAIICQQKHRSTLPQDLSELMALPGIGRSTAAAIMSLAYKQPEPIMDGNVKRVFARHFLVSGEPNKSSTMKQFWYLAEKHRELDHPAAYTQGLMDLGATVCTKHNPRCELCPVNQTCQAKDQDMIAQYPEKKKKVVQREMDLYCLLRVDHDKVLLSMRNEQSIWPNLWFLPIYDSEQRLMKSSSKAQKQFSLTHKLTHRILHLHIYTDLQAKKTEKLEWVARHQLNDIPHPKALIHILNQHDNHHLH